MNELFETDSYFGVLTPEGIFLFIWDYSDGWIVRFYKNDPTDWRK